MSDQPLPQAPLLFPIPGSRRAGVPDNPMDQYPPPSLPQNAFPIPGQRSWTTTESLQSQTPYPSLFPLPGIVYKGGLPVTTISSDQSASTSISTPMPNMNMDMDINGPDADNTMAILSAMPPTDPRHGMWTEWIKLKTRTLELQIAEAKRKEREAELELEKLKLGMSVGGANGSTGPPTPRPGAGINNDMARVLGLQGIGLEGPLGLNPDRLGPLPAMQYNHLLDPQPMTPFDLQALLDQNDMFNWLPDLENTDQQQFGTDTSFQTKTEVRSPSPSPKKPEKKIVMEHHSSCSSCGKTVARILLRAPRSKIPLPVRTDMRCTACAGVTMPSPEPGPTIGSIESRKRIRQSLEVEGDRVFCDVCQRVTGAGHVYGQNQDLASIAEIICVSCDTKYQRCTDCGGGGGPRVGIGKWRLKQVFQPGRKTCSLSHNRLGDRPREIGVHCPQTDFTPDQLKEVLSRCHALWTEKTLSRLAVPEMLEIDLPPNYINPLKNYEDVAEIVAKNWPTRQALFDKAVPDQFKRLLGLTWAHSRPRRSAKTVDIEEYGKSSDGDMSTVLDNVKRTNVVIPAGSELIGMWGGEWDMINGSLLISSFYPFEGTDGEDSTALSVGELITYIQSLRTNLNSTRPSTDKLPPCEHLWVVSGGTLPLIRERMADILVRKRSFVHVDEYLTRHPEFTHAVQARPVGLHSDPQPNSKPLILARWLGKDFDAQKILEIKQMEFGGRKKRKR